ncbi:hypothetical protein Fmac_019871 [Flemingia macrophylla]|uniref:F-box domain-containing protein n=1 Tax=Flemingia macrophylla TaxID=520843 RepID=A0ABD1M934_9FABA
MREKMKANSDVDNDMIKQLPDPILQQILLLLPITDAALMASVSKYSHSLWNSLSALHFSFDEIAQRPSFHTKGMLYSSIIAYVNDWISLVLKNCVKDIKLSFSNIAFSLPLDIFSAKSLLTLNIQGCSIHLEEPLFAADHAPVNRLKELSLSKFDASSYVFRKILSYSTLLEKIVLKEISDMGFLQICSLPMLSYVEIEQKFVDKRQIFSLETLLLSFCSCARIEVACSHLRTMTLPNKGSEKPLDVEVDVPELEQLNYEGYVVPSFQGMQSHVKPTVTLKLGLGGRPGTDVAVRRCIEMLNQPTLHLVYLYGRLNNTSICLPIPFRCFTLYLSSGYSASKSTFHKQGFHTEKKIQPAVKMKLSSDAGDIN